MKTFRIDAQIKISIWDYEIEAENEAAALKLAKTELSDYYDLNVYGMPHNVEHGYELKIDADEFKENAQ
jgi:hypothetical protein